MLIRPYRTLENVIEGAVITFVDITKLKRAQEALREREIHFQQLAESLPQPVWTWRPDGLCDYLSLEWVEFTGVPAAQQLGLGWLDQVHPDDRSALTSAWNKAVSTGEPYKGKFRIRHHSGDYHWFDTRATALRDTAGRIVKWVGVNTDLTERRPDSADTTAEDAAPERDGGVP